MVGAIDWATLSTTETRSILQRVRQKDTALEVPLCWKLFVQDLGYNFQVPVLSKPRRMVDLAFIEARVAVFCDGCFWNGCPAHGTRPKNNAEFWRANILANQQRDLDISEHLRTEEWEVVRVWAHEAPNLTAARIEDIVRSRRLAKESA